MKFICKEEEKPEVKLRLELVQAADGVIVKLIDDHSHPPTGRYLIIFSNDGTFFRYRHVSPPLPSGIKTDSEGRIEEHRF